MYIFALISKGYEHYWGGGRTHQFPPVATSMVPHTLVLCCVLYNKQPTFWLREI